MKYFSLFLKKIKAYRIAFLRVYKSMTSHSRAVLLLKVAIPSFIALFLGVVVLIPRLDEEKDKIKISFPSIDTTSDISFVMDNGKFYGQGENGSIFSVDVENSKENRKDALMSFSKIKGKVFMSNASWINLSTDNGIYKRDKNIFTMIGNIVIDDSDGNKAYTDEAMVNMNDMSVIGKKSIRGYTNFGNIESDGFDFKKDDRYIFTGKIKGFIDTSKIEK